MWNNMKTGRCMSLLLVSCSKVIGKNNFKILYSSVVIGKTFTFRQKINIFSSQDLYINEDCSFNWLIYIKINLVCFMIDNFNLR